MGEHSLGNRSRTTQEEIVPAGRYNGYYLRHDVKKSDHFTPAPNTPFMERRMYTAEHDPNVHITMWDETKQWKIDIVDPNHAEHTVNVPIEVHCGCCYYYPRGRGKP